MQALTRLNYLILTILFLSAGVFAQNINVSATGGTGNASYATMKAAFDAINAGTHTGTVTIEIAANVAEPANTSAVLNSSGAGAASYDSVLIRPAADDVTVTGAGGDGAQCGGRGLIELNGADNVTIDGDNPNSAGTNRNLTFSNTCGTSHVAVIRIAMSSLVNTANNLTFRNINVSGNAVGRNTAANSVISEPGNPTGYSWGIYAGGNASTTNAANPPSTFTDGNVLLGNNITASNLTIENSSFINSGAGVMLRAATRTIFPNFLVRRNLVGNPNAGETNQIYHYGISTSGSNGGVISENTVYVESYLNIVQQAIAIGAGGSVNTSGVVVERNFVRRARGNNLRAAAGNGIHIFTDFPNTVRNNFVTGVGSRSSGVFVGLIGTYGIFLGRGPGHRVYNNTVYMSGDLAGNDPNISAALALNVGTGSGIDVRNNILINTQTQSGADDPLASVHVSLYLSGSNRDSSYNLTLNNNIYFQGTAINSGILQVGENAGGADFYTAANFNPNSTSPANNMRSYTSRLNTAGTNDNQSKVVNPRVVSATDLHLQPNSPAIDAGANVGVFDDFDGQIRTNAPDIGADESDGAAPQTNDVAAYGFLSPMPGAYLAPNASFTPSAQFINLGTATQTNVQARFEILDASANVVYSQTAMIPSIAPNQIVAVEFPAATLPNAGNYTLRITSELAGDQNAANNSLTSAAVRVLAPLSGTVNVGAAETYKSLTDVGGLFQALNSAGASGNLVVNLTSDLTTESGAVRLNELPAGTTLTIKPSGAPRTISGNAPINTALIALNGADNVTIDGSLNGGTDRSLTVSMGSGVAAIYLASGANGAQNNTIKNVNITRNLSAGTTYGIFVGGNSLPSNGADNDNNRFQNNSIQGVSYGIASRGASAANKNTGTVITQNEMTGTGERRIRRAGIYLTFDDGAQITDNQIANVSNDLFGDAIGIALGTDSVGTTTATGAEVSNALVARNRISGVQNTISFSAVGILVTGAATGTNNIVNNTVSGVIAPSATFDITAGIFIGTQAGGTQNVFYNSVSLTGARTPADAFSTIEGSFAIAVNGGDFPVNIRNNIFSNTQMQTPQPPETAKNFAVGIGYPAFTNLNFDHNVLYVAGAQGRLALTSGLRNEEATEYVDFASFRQATNTNANSLALDPRFVSETDLRIQTGVPTPIENRGTPIPSVTTDINGSPRSATAPDIGAFEGNYTALSGADAAATQIIAPVAGRRIVGGAGSSQTPQAVFANAGATALANIQVEFTIIGPGGYSYSNTKTITSLPVGGSVAITFDAAPPFTAAGTYTASARIVTPDDNKNNDFVNAIFPVVLPLNGSFNVGAGGNYTSLSNAGGIFETLNAVGASGDIVINLTSDLLTETGEIALNELSAGVNVTIKPAGAARRISGSSNNAIIKLFGADNVTIDGSLNGGTDRSLTIINEGLGAILWIGDNETSGATGNTVKNCNLVGADFTQGIVAGSGNQIGFGGQFPNSNNKIQNNRITRVQNGIFISGADADLDQNWTITDNVMGGFEQDEKLTFRGVFIGNAQNFIITRNRITNITSLPGASGIMSGVMISNNIDGGTISRNEILGVRQNNEEGYGSNGIYLNSISDDANLTVANNFVSGVSSYGFNGTGTNDNGYGIMIQQGGGYRVYYNSVWMNANQTLPESITAAINIGGGVLLTDASNLNAADSSKRGAAPKKENKAAVVPQVNAIDVRGNIFANTQTVGTRYAIYVGSPSGAAVFSDINYNDYFSSQAVGYLNGAQTTLANWQAATGRDQNSKAVDPRFVATTDLHLRRDSPLINAGAPIAGVTTDFDGQTRDAEPDLGADEFSVRSPIGDFDGDGRTDLIVFRPSNGTWYVRQSANNIPFSAQFGLPGDIAVPGDYDGDRRMDFAVYRPSEGRWYIQQTSNGAVVEKSFGIASDKPVQADYDGDGKTDIAVWREQTGVWYVLRSSDEQWMSAVFGQTGDVPVQANYDGDGRADFAVYRSGTWWILRSSDGNAVARQFGASGDVPVPGDFDGDERTDLAVYRGGEWWIQQSQSGAARVVQFGLPDDVAVPGDYDGDGRFDTAVFRPSTGTWWITNSSSGGLVTGQWGLATDVPVPAAYRTR